MSHSVSNSLSGIQLQWQVGGEYDDWHIETKYIKEQTKNILNCGMKKGKILFSS